MANKLNNVTNIERVSALIEEQALTKEELMDYLRQVVEIRVFENNISNLLGRAVLKLSPSERSARCVMMT